MKFNKRILSAGIILWAIAIAIGTIWVTDYVSRPGRSAIAPVNLELTSPTAAVNLPKLLVFLHPHCPCSCATLAGLSRLNARNTGLVDVSVFFYQPSDQSREWVETDLWHRVSVIPNLSVAAITEAEIQKFGAITSGQTLLYDTRQQIVFSGGITGGRGHEGDNAGLESIERFLRTGETAVSQTPVFGCILTATE